jgi:biopolymer transport protein ExbB
MDETVTTDVTDAGLWSAVSRALDILFAGGPVAMILLALSVVALGVVLAKLAQYQALGLHRPESVRAALAAERRGRPEAALAALRGARHPAAKVLTTALHARWRADVDPGLLREEIERQGQAVLASLRSHTRVLEVIATLSPLLGLFGTVLGMIDAFRQMEAAGSQVDPSVLSGGIWEALLTTAFGLAVAIPATAAVNWLDRVVERVEHEMADAVTQVLTGPALRSQQEEPADAPVQRTAAGLQAAE